MARDTGASLEERMRALEDRLEIFNIIASHPPSADSGSDNYYRDAFATDGLIDLGGGKEARGNEAIAAMVKTPEHKGAIAGGIAHFCGLPFVEVDADRAVATSYLQIVTPDGNGAPVAVSGHGTTNGFRIHRIGVNRWEFLRTDKGWKVTRRTLRPLDGSPDALRILHEAVAHLGA
jgi:SnoaL-like domain